MSDIQPSSDIQLASEVQRTSGLQRTDDPANMVRQARRMRPSAALVSVAEIVDVLFIASFGAFSTAISVAMIAAMFPGPKDPLSIAGCSFAAGLVGFALYMLSALIPIFFPGALLTLQLVSGSLAGPIALDIICSWLGIDLKGSPLLALLSSAWLTFNLSIMPILACPAYFAVLLSSRWQTTFGWSIVGLMVCDENGQRASLQRTFKRTIYRLWWPIMFPGTLSSSAFIDDWVEEKSDTVLVLKPQNLRAEMIRANDQLTRSTNKLTITSRNSLIGENSKQSLGIRGQSTALSAQALKKMLKPDWPAIILRTESYFVVMLGMLFLARSAVASYTQIYFSGYAIAGADAASKYGTVASLLAQYPQIGEYLPIVLAAFYIGAIIFWRRSIPQVLTLSSSGFTLTAPHHKVKNKNYRWEDVSAARLEQGEGKEQEEKWLVFDMSNNKPVRIRLDIIRSISSKEEILHAIERWAPNCSKDPELLSTLQPPSNFSYTDIWLEALTAPPKRDKLKPLVPGAVLKDKQYRVAKLIAVGGQGSVYLANDCVSGDEAVLKEFVLPVYVDLAIRRKAIERFEKEARLLKSLDHPQIVKLLDYFVEDHRAYMVLEHLNGKNLHQVVKESGKQSDETVTSLALQMCKILEYLHGQDPAVVHRDFTPENLILGLDGVLRLIDFNVAQTLDQSATTTGTVVGKPSYLAPEQFQGEPTHLSDIYSFGATLHYLLTGADPLPISQSHPSKIVPDVSANLDLIVSICTSYDQTSRYASVKEIEQAIMLPTSELAI